MSGICSPALAGRVRRGGRRQQTSWGFASQNPQLKNGTEAIFEEAKNGKDAVFRPRKG
jgi:hypothetical protein